MLLAASSILLEFLVLLVTLEIMKRSGKVFSPSLSLFLHFSSFWLRENLLFFGFSSDFSLCLNSNLFYKVQYRCINSFLHWEEKKVSTVKCKTIRKLVFPTQVFLFSLRGSCCFLHQLILKSAFNSFSFISLSLSHTRLFHFLSLKKKVAPKNHRDVKNHSKCRRE